MENKSRPVPDSAGKSGPGRVLHRAPSQALLDALHFVFRFVGWTVRWTGALIFLVAVMALVALYVFNQAAAGGGYVTVPDVSGLPVTRAANVLAEVGLDLGDQHQVRNDRVPEYHVIVQQPRAGEVVRAGRKVSLTISQGRQFETAPNFFGFKVADALAKLESTRLVAGSIARIPDSRPADTILSQDPAWNQPVPIGGEIHLLVSSGPVKQAIMMPSLVGKSMEEAQLILANLDVQAEPFNVDRPGAEYEVVLAQNPEPGTLLTDGQKVSFDVRLRTTSYLPNAKRRVLAEWSVPDYGRPVSVRVESSQDDADFVLRYPTTSHYVDGRPQLLAAHTLLRVDLVYTNEITVRFYVEGGLHTTYYYQGEVTQPLITHHTAAQPNVLPAPQEDELVEMEELEPAEPANPFVRRPRPPTFSTP